MTSLSRLVLLTAGALTAGGCGSAVSGDAVSATVTASSNTLTRAGSSPAVSNTLPAPHAPPDHNSDGTTFDPCLTYSAAELMAWGVDPASVEDAADGLQRGCIWKGDGWVLQQLVNNQTIADYLNLDNYPDARPLNVAGLQGSVDRGQQKGTTFCSVQIPSQKSAVATLVSVRDSKAEKVIPDACVKAVEIATATAGKLPK
ncbi:hypothetical protein HNP40_001339 [Mycobacteroides chelonae]|nr:hypothetical protein [Mycobacteroides chelonae]